VSNLKNIVDENSRVVVQGITGNEGRFHTEAMLSYGTRVVAGVTPGSRFKVYLSITQFLRQSAMTVLTHLLYSSLPVLPEVPSLKPLRLA